MPRARRIWGTKDVASCMQVMRVLQSYLDGEADERTARRVAKHIGACRRCGLEAKTYREIKSSLARRAAPLDQVSVSRLVCFALELAGSGSGGNGNGSAS